MKYAFETLVNVFFYHSYFSGEIFQGFQINPDKNTSRDMLNYGILLKPFSGGFRLLYDTSFAGGIRSRQEMLKENITLGFALKLNDPEFYNYTAVVERDITRTIYYFNNNSEKANTSKSLHMEEYVSEKDVYQLDQFEDQYFVRPFAKLDMQLNLQLADTYSIKFKARESYWRYILLGEHLQNLSSPAVVDSASSEFFEGPFRLPVRGKEAIAFRSKEPISFSQNIRNNFQLVENYDPQSGRYKVVMRALPAPEPGHINLLEPGSDIKDQRNYSEIFIN